MKKLIFASLIVSLPAFLYAVYAPIPVQDQGHPVTVSLEGGFLWDSNIFGAPVAEQDSMIVRIAPEVRFNASLSPQTMLIGNYGVEALFYDDRPAEDTLFNHTLGVRLAHTVSEVSSLDISDTLSVMDNPESLLPSLGVLQTDQSFVQNVFNVKGDFEVGSQTKSVLKLRHTNMAYDNSNVSKLLDHSIFLLGAEGHYKMVPETTLVGEIRYQDVGYDTDGGSKDSDSVFGLVGIDYQPDEVTNLTSRIGLENRSRNGGKDNKFFYLEVMAAREYLEGSFVSGGIRSSVGEADDTSRFLDHETTSVFGSFQHAVTGQTYLSGSLSFDQSTLNAKRPFTAVDEDSVRFGLGATYEPDENWAVIIQYDYDDTSSDDPQRDQNRSRFGIYLRYTFGVE